MEKTAGARARNRDAPASTAGWRGDGSACDGWRCSALPPVVSGKSSPKLRHGDGYLWSLYGAWSKGRVAEQMLPLPIQFLIATIAAAINERMARQLEYAKEVEAIGPKRRISIALGAIEELADRQGSSAFPKRTRGAADDRRRALWDDRVHQLLERDLLQKEHVHFPTYERWLTEKSPELAQEYRHRDRHPSAIEGTRFERPVAHDIRAFKAVVDGWKVRG